MSFQILRSTVIVRLNCGSSVIFSLCSQQCIDCILNLSLNERHCLVQAKQGVNSIKSHDNLRQKASVFFFFFLSLKVVEAAFCVGVKTKRPTRNPVCIRETPVRGVRSLPPQTKNPRYGPDRRYIFCYVLVWYYKKHGFPLKKGYIYLK